MKFGTFTNSITLVYYSGNFAYPQPTRSVKQEILCNCTIQGYEYIQMGCQGLNKQHPTTCICVYTYVTRFAKT